MHFKGKDLNGYMDGYTLIRIADVYFKHKDVNEWMKE